MSSRLTSARATARRRRHRGRKRTARTKSASGPAAPPRAAKPHRSRGWIAATVILVLALIGVGAWALWLRADYDDSEIEANSGSCSGVFGS
jgi:hypothetical protein